MARDDRECATLNDNVYIDLDCILDTRLPVLYALSEDIAKESLRSGYYHKRVSDNFGIIPNGLFYHYYDKRTKYVLALATPTPMFELLLELTEEAATSIVTDSIETIPTLYVNTYPYELNEEEAVTILKLLYTVIPVQMNFDLICKSLTELTPEWVDANANTVIKYDIVKWLELHSSLGNLSTCPLLRGACIGPLIATGNIPVSEITQESFEETRSTLGPMCNLVFMQSRLFSHQPEKE